MKTVFALCLVWAAVAATCPALAETPATLNLVVMDPLAKPLACDCVQGYAQRDYEQLATRLERRLGMPVRLAFSESLPKAVQEKKLGAVHLVIGKDSVVLHDAREMKLPVTRIACLTDTLGRTTQHGLIVVPKDDSAKTVADLAGYTILFGPVSCDEKHAAAIETIKAAGVTLPKEPVTRPACSIAATDILNKDFQPGAAAVISSYAAPLLEGCGAIDPGALRVIASVRDVPFVAAFSTGHVGAELQVKLQKALLAVGDDPELCRSLETGLGFIDPKKAAIMRLAEPAPIDAALRAKKN